MRKQRFRGSPRTVVLMIVGLIVAGLLVAACGTASCSDSQRDLQNAQSVYNDDSTKLDNAKKDHNADAIAEAQQNLADAKTVLDRTKADAGNQCGTSAAPKSTTPAPPGVNQTATVTTYNGTVQTLPIVDDNGNVIQGNSTTDPRTPATYADALKGGPVKSWADYANRLGGLKWYVDGVNARKSETGFDWSDVQKFAQYTNVDARVIHVYNVSVTDQQARDDVRNLIGSDADKLPVLRDNSCIVNTWGFTDKTPRMYDFLDCRQMVRVELLPVETRTVNGTSQLALVAGSGAFADCDNIFSKPQKVVKSTPATTTSAATTTATTAATTTPPARTTTPAGTTSSSARTTPPTTHSSHPSTPATTTPPPTTPSTGKNYRQSPVTSDYSAPPARRPNDPTPPPVVVRTGSSYTAPPPAAPTTMDAVPSEATNTQPVAPQATGTATSSSFCDSNGDGVPDDNC